MVGSGEPPTGYDQDQHILSKHSGDGRGTHEERDVESGDEANAGQEEPNVTANDTKLSLERQLIQSMSLYHPASAEADMRKTDTAPDKEV